MKNWIPVLLVLLALSGQVKLASSLFHTQDPIKSPIPRQCNNSFIKHLIPLAYPFETRKTITEDGYINTMFRLQKKGTRITPGKPVVYIQHGLYSGGGTWFDNSEDQAAPFIFANAGFDVWIGNNRGSRYSRSHVNLTATDKAYWEFSFDEMARYDVPAFIALIRNVTGVEKIVYIGHSQGTTQMFAALSDAEIRPKVAPFVKQFHALAPIVFMNQPKGATAQELADSLFDGAKKTLAGGVNYLSIGSCVWDQQAIDFYNKYCEANRLTCAKNYAKDWSASPEIAARIDNWPRAGYKKEIDVSGSSVGNLVHLGQLIVSQLKKSGSFPKYDYGPAGNLKKYGTKTAPLYDLGLIKETVRMWVGSEDIFATIPEADALVKAAKNADISYEVIQEWGHCAFQFAAETHKFYLRIIDVINRG